jgi:hypothetical protein
VLLRGCVCALVRVAGARAAPPTGATDTGAAPEPAPPVTLRYSALETALAAPWGAARWLSPTFAAVMAVGLHRAAGGAPGDSAGPEAIIAAHGVRAGAVSEALLRCVEGGGIGGGGVDELELRAWNGGGGMGMDSRGAAGSCE